VKPKSTYIKDFINSFVSIAKGLWVTVIHWSIARPSVTELYPDVMPILPEAYRGVPSLPTNAETGRSGCIGCGACARMCPEGIIKIEVDKSDPKDRKPAKFTIDISRCMWCGLCTEVCPTNCLKFGRDFELACYNREDMVYGLEKLQEMGGELEVKEEESAEPQDS
jgi:NADH-quinone oxidoreductase subunit I